MYGVFCFVGVVVCKVFIDGFFIDIGWVVGLLIFNLIVNEIYLNFESSIFCLVDKYFNYILFIVFYCKRGVSMGMFKLLRISECDFVFEWEIFVVCFDEVRMDGCILIDEQFFYSFNLFSFFMSIFKVICDLCIYSVGVCIFVVGLE